MRVLVALDRSERDEAAVLAATRLAEAAGAEVVLCNIVHPWLDATLSPGTLERERLEAVVADRRAYLERRAAAFAGVPVTVRVEPLRWPPYARAEEVAEALARVARDLGADIVVVASKRASGLLGLLLGSTARGLLRASPCPVLVVRPDWVSTALLDVLTRGARALEESEREGGPAPRLVPRSVPNGVARSGPLRRAG
jgi:nucleotide-binding universal stress UspA family protein